MGRRIQALAFCCLFVANTVGAQQNQVELINVAPGCEDVAYDDTSTAPRLILSCDNRRDSRAQGGFYSLDLLSHHVTPLTISGVRPRSLHPHGISLVRRGSGSYLYAINHQRKNQSASGKNFTEVLAFRVSANELHYVTTIGIESQSLFANPNDLFALPSGEVFMSNPSSLAHSLLYYSPRTRRWSVAARGFLYPNGVHMVGRELLVNTSVGGKQYSYTHLGNGKLSARRLRAKNLGAADNITENAVGDLYFSGAQSFVEFLRYFLSPTYVPASDVFRLRDSSLEKLKRPDLRYVISAPSVAFEYHDRLYLGQVFDDFIAVVNHPEWTTLR